MKQMSQTVFLPQRDPEKLGLLRVRQSQAGPKTNHQLQCICKNKQTEANNNIPVLWCFFFSPKGIKVVSGSKLSERKRLVERGIGQSRSKLLAEWNRNIPTNYRSTKRLQKDTGRYSDPLSSLNSCICVLNDLPKIIYTSATNQKKRERRD